jgi:hypothetical protein
VTVYLTCLTRTCKVFLSLNCHVNPFYCVAGMPSRGIVSRIFGSHGWTQAQSHVGARRMLGIPLHHLAPLSISCYHVLAPRGAKLCWEISVLTPTDHSKTRGGGWGLITKWSWTPKCVFVSLTNMSSGRKRKFVDENTLFLHRLQLFYKSTASYDRHCDLVVSVEDYKHRGPGFDSRTLLRIFLRELGLERGPLSLVIG